MKIFESLQGSIVKKLIVFMLALAMISAPLASSAAAPKPGASCSKVGTKITTSGKVYTCVKSGSKRVWNKGVALKPKTKPTLTWSNAAANASRLNENVWVEALKYKSSASRQVISGRLIVSSPNAYFGKTNLSKTLNDAETFFSWATLPATYKVLHYSTGEIDWANNKANEWFGGRDLIDNTFSGGRGGRVFTGEFFISLNLDVQKLELRPEGDDWKHVITHEFVHVVQAAQTEMPMKSAPWLVEGGANFFAALITSQSKSQFDQARSGALGASRPWKEGVLAQLNRTAGGATGDDYNMGFYATQALAGMYGLGKVVNFYKATSENSNFSDAFFKTFGESWETIKPNLADTMIALSKLPW
jgi:hypothetical protein